MHVADADLDRLTNLAEGRAGAGAALLSQELERAVVVAEGEPLDGFVRLYSTVEFVELSTGRRRTVQLTPPDEADIDASRCSVLAPVGAALIGLSVGDVFRWRGDDGRLRGVTVLRVTHASPSR